MFDTFLLQEVEGFYSFSSIDVPLTDLCLFVQCLFIFLPLFSTPTLLICFFFFLRWMMHARIKKKRLGCATRFVNNNNNNNTLQFNLH